MRQTLILGGPGAGKTEKCLRIIDSALQRGVAPNRIAVVTFTRAAAEVARTRACQRFSLEPDQLPHFRTIHSLCFRELSLRRTEVLDDFHLKELSELTGELVTGILDTEGPATKRAADSLLTIDHYARTTRQSLRDAWHDHGGDVDWFRLKRFSETYKLFKQDHNILDFTDMLFNFTLANQPVDVDVAIVDEAQDLAKLQWAAVDVAFANVQELWIAGDDDQQIHHWAGADAEHFMNLPYTREVLPLSHRLPRSIFNLSQEIVHRVGRRFAKEQAPSDRDGAVNWFNRPEEVDLTTGSHKSLDWLLLARTRSQLTELIETARDQGVVYSVKGATSVNAEHVRAIQSYEALRAGKRISGADVLAVLRAAGLKMVQVVEEDEYAAADLQLSNMPIWHDALIRIPLTQREYYLSCLRRGESLTKPPRVRIETIHGAKGMEAEHVLLTTDLTYRTQRAFELDPDSEHRVFYVGTTRASETLNLIAPQTQYGFPL